MLILCKIFFDCIQTLLFSTDWPVSGGSSCCEVIVIVVIIVVMFFL